MSKFSELQDVQAEALARKNRRLNEAKKFCSEFAKALSVLWQTNDDAMFFVKDRNVLSPEPMTGKFLTEPDHLVFSKGEITTWLGVRIDGGIAFAQIMFIHDEKAKTFQVAIGKSRSIFDVRDYNPIAEHVFASIKRQIEKCSDGEHFIVEID